MKRFIYLISMVLLCSCQQLSSDRISFNEEIRPILNNKCLRCHGGVRANGGFSLLFEEDALRTLESGLSAIVPGNHENSALYNRIVSQDPAVRMPFEAEPLTSEEIDLLSRWIDQGAQWEKHWAYILPRANIEPPEKGEIPWAKNDIDNFVYHKMQEKELSPAPEAEKATLLRRVYLDLIGLPPTPEEAAEFVNDDSPDAYEKLVERLLSSPHFGERWASMWLDLARYADSKGYEKDTNREIWKFRDWVISAFNQDMPFNQFSIEQLAGDLLPNPTEQQLVATAFHRNTLANDEGGTDNEEYRVAAVLDRVSTTYEVWQGTTMSCVQCHSHPYDPIRHEEFYQSMAFFNNTEDKDAYFELPKLHTYSEENAGKAKVLIDYITNELALQDLEYPKGKFLHSQKDSLLSFLGYRVIEAETYDESSAFIELAKGLKLIDQVQDGSWLRYDEVDLSDVKRIGFLASTRFKYGGNISIHLDSLEGQKIGEVRITNPSGGTTMEEFATDIRSTGGKHDLYLRFSIGETYEQHLFSIDKIVYYQDHRRMDSFDEEFNEKLRILAEIPTTTTPIMQELEGDKARKTVLFERGSWLDPGKEVRPGIPDVYGMDSLEEPSTRLEFAEWLVNDSNPLSARIVVNRFWEQLFGHGLVQTMEDFGTQGDKPSHPELLDWLSVRLMEKYQWRMKPLIQEMVLSATYRQSSKVDSVKLNIDPRNKWFSWTSRTRLSAEQIRDQILAVSGLLKRTVGGPSVSNRDVNGGWRGIPEWVIQDESGMNRRSLYTLWKRVTPPMGMISFDSPDRSLCSSRRIRTNTPSQALDLLNDETFFEASEALAAEMFKVDELPENQLRYGYRRVMSREIDAEKLRVLKQFYFDALEHYDQIEGGPLVGQGAMDSEKSKLAALAVVCNVLLNLDEFIVKG